MPYENLNILFFNDLYGTNNQSLVGLLEKLWQEYIRSEPFKFFFYSIRKRYLSKNKNIEMKHLTGHFNLWLIVS